MKYSSLSAEELVKACAESQNAEAWEEFVRRYRKLIAAVVWRTARGWGETNKSVIDELIQDTFLKICADNCRLLRTFQPKHPKSFEGLLKVTAANVVHDYVRARRSEKRGAGIADVDVSEVAPFVPDRHSSGVSQIHQGIQLQEIDRILVANDSPTAKRDRDIFWLHNLQGWTAEEIARIPLFELSVKGVESALLRLKRLVCQALAVKPDRSPEVEQTVEPPPQGAQSEAERPPEVEQPAEPESPREIAEGNRAEKPLAKGEGQT